jgi:sulfur carrier protein ThiS
MKIKIRLFGTLGNKFPEHDPIKGFEVEIHEDSTVNDLINKMGISQSKIGIISINGKLVTPLKKLKKGDFVRMFQPIFGG